MEQFDTQAEQIKDSIVTALADFDQKLAARLQASDQKLAARMQALEIA